MKALVQSQRGEIGRLVDEVARCKMRTGEGKTREQKRALARKIYEASIATYAGEPLPERVRELERMRDGVDPDMTSYFVDRYREATAADPDASSGSLWQSDPRRHAWFLVFAAGGEEAARFLKDWIDDPATSREDRARGLAALSTVSMSDTQNLEKVPVDASLAATALGLAQSDLPGDRSGAADLLGRVDTPEARVALRRLADTDPDPEIRGVALRSMGRIGTRETLAYLRTYPIPSDGDGGWVIRVSLSESIKELTLMFPE
ncbi:MAG TPA: HEAT repeat domain-containing protein [Planctomycetota bacterium]|nr:HEAT repeat domain-containing protein [Planctomycetota bacterium]